VGRETIGVESSHRVMHNPNSTKVVVVTDTATITSFSNIWFRWIQAS